MNEEYMGVTPYSYSDTKIVGSTTSIRLEKEGYEPFYTSLSRNEEVDVGAIIGGIFVLVPFLWTMKYKPVHNYELVPLDGTQAEEEVQDSVGNSYATKEAKLRELKRLMDEGLINMTEYNREKNKVLYSSGN